MSFRDLDVSKQAFIYAAIYLLSNRLQTLGDKLDPTISSKQWLLLAAISQFGDTPPNLGDIAGGFGVSRQNVKKMAAILERRGYLRFEKDKDDLRSMQLILTDQCIEYFNSREQRDNEYIECIFNDIDDRTLSGLYDGMKKLIENIDTLLES